MKYGSSVPFDRQQRLQSILEVPLPADILAQTVSVLAPVSEGLIRQAAQGAVLYNDDTKMPILALTGKSPPEVEKERNKNFSPAELPKSTSAGDNLSRCIPAPTRQRLLRESAP